MDAAKTLTRQPAISIMKIFKRDPAYYEGVARINIYLLRLLFALTFVFVGMSSWAAIAFFEGTWEPVRAVAFCAWAAYGTICFLGLIKPLKLLPIVLFQIFYKVLWLAIVAYPLWINDKLAGSTAEEMAYAFLWVPLAIVAMPWRYFFRQFISKNDK